MEDKLVVKGINDNIDGEYACDILGMLTVGHPESLTIREYRQIKLMTGLVAGQVWEAIQADDLDASVGLCGVILSRHNKTYRDEWLWDAKPEQMGFIIKAAEEDDIPEAEGVPESTPTNEPETNGGEPSAPSSESPVSDLSPTGIPHSDTSAT